MTLSFLTVRKKRPTRLMKKTWCSADFRRKKQFKPYTPYVCTKNSRMMATVSLFHVLVDMKGPSGNGQSRGSSNPYLVATLRRKLGLGGVILGITIFWL